MLGHNEIKENRQIGKGNQKGNTKVQQLGAEERQKGRCQCPKGRGDSMLIPAQQKDLWDKDSRDKDHWPFIVHPCTPTVHPILCIQSWGSHVVFLESSLPSLT